MRNLGIGLLTALLALGCMKEVDASAPTNATSSAPPEAAGTTAPAPPAATDEYTKDLDKICHVHQITGKPAELGLVEVSQWLLDNIQTTEARNRLAELPKADIPAWLQNLRRDAAARGISPCPFSDTWEGILKRPPN